MLSATDKATRTQEGGIDLKGSMSGGQDPLLTPLPSFFRLPFAPLAAWFSSLDSHL